MAAENIGKTLRSTAWYAGDDRNAYIHRAWMRRGGPADAFDGRPSIAIANTASDLAACNTHLDEVAQSVKYGVYEAGGIPYNLPIPSLGETTLRTTAMLWRNMAAMAAEELLRANPVDAVVLLGACDKTIPALLMAAASVGIPAIVVPGGPMLNGTFRGRPLGCGTDVWKLSEEVRAGTLDEAEFRSTESAMIRSRGTCNTMGTASTMACVTEALGMTLPGAAGIPAADSRLLQLAHESGVAAVGMAREGGPTPAEVMTPAAFHNAIVTLSAVGGSTNAVVHLLAIAGRLGVELTLDDFDRIGAEVPLLVNLQPAGEYLMEDFFRAGGLRSVLAEVRELLDPSAITVTGAPLVDRADGEIWDESVIRRLDAPLQEKAGIAVVRGNLAPNGAIVKPAAATPELLQHRGPAVVFDSIEDLHARIDDPDLDVTAESVLVLRGCGPRGYPGMPEVANLPLPRKLLEQGVRDMVRVCDGRMSGTAYGTVVLHVAPEAAAGGPLALVRDGDEIELDVTGRRLVLHVPEEELAAREAPAVFADALAAPVRGWQKLYVDHVTQADTGADLDILQGASGSAVMRESH